MSNRNALLDQKLNHSLNEGRTLHDFVVIRKLKFNLSY